MLWGCVLEGNKTHTHLVEDTYQVAQAALEPNSKSQNSAPDLVSVWVKSEEGDEFLLCTLEHGKSWQAPVSLLAMEGSEMMYLVKGDGKVHLTGTLVPEDDEFDDMNGFGEEEDLSDEEDEELDTSNGEIDARNVINGKRAALALPASGSPAKKLKNEGGKAVAKTAVPVPKSAKPNGVKVEQDDDDEEDDDDESDEEMDSSLGKLLAGTDDFDDDEDDEDEDDDDEEDMDDEDKDDEVAGKAGKPQMKNNLSKNTQGQQKPKVQVKQESNITPKPKGNKFAGGDQKKQTPGPGKNQNQQGNRSFGGNNSNQKGGFNNNQKGGFNKQGGGGGQQKGGSPFGNNKQARLKQLEVVDKVPGHGPTATPGKMVHVAYVGRLNENKKEFDRNSKGFSFRLGKGQVIKGWEEGLKNMKVGGKRVIKIPSSLGYGSKSCGPIPANSDLEFEVELKAVTK